MKNVPFPMRPLKTSLSYLRLIPGVLTILLVVKTMRLVPHVLGYIFEKYINQKSFGAYYTRPQITEYLCNRSIHKLILEKINAAPHPRQNKGL